MDKATEIHRGQQPKLLCGCCRKWKRDTILWVYFDHAKMWLCPSCAKKEIKTDQTSRHT